MSCLSPLRTSGSIYDLFMIRCAFMSGTFLSELAKQFRGGDQGMNMRVFMELAPGSCLLMHGISAGVVWRCIADWLPSQVSQSALLIS